MISNALIDEWGGETLITKYERKSGAWIIVALHSTKLGPATGGVRMMHYDSVSSAVRDCLLLSKAMTKKFAVANKPWGGAKVVIATPKKVSVVERIEILRSLASMINFLDGSYYAGPDIGISSIDMDLIYNFGVPYVFSRSVRDGGAGPSSIPTAYGVFAAIQSLCNHIYGKTELQEKRILVQGAGSVGSYLMDLLRNSGAKVLFSETDRNLIEKHIKHYQFVEPSKVYTTECDIFSPCAKGGILTNKTISQLRCKGIAGAANNQLSNHDCADLLKQHDMLYAPDYISNLGGAVGTILIEWDGMSLRDSLTEVQYLVGTKLHEVFTLAENAGINTLMAAEKILKGKNEAS